jgi:hypothetical protein
MLRDELAQGLSEVGSIRSIQQTNDFIAEPRILTEV